MMMENVIALEHIRKNRYNIWKRIEPQFYDVIVANSILHIMDPLVGEFLHTATWKPHKFLA